MTYFVKGVRHLKTILITGANRGLGLEFVNQLSSQGSQIIASCRDPEHADVLQQWAKSRKNLSIHKLDVSDDRNIIALANELRDTPLDWIINNAGISGEAGVTVGNIKRDNFLNVFNVNCLSALKVSEAFLPHLYKGQDKLVVNISSQLSSISENQRGRSYAYRSSKAALNCVMRAFALDVEQDGIKVMLLHPGWVRTQLGGPDASIDVQTSVSGMLNIIEKYKNNGHAEVLRSYNDQTIGW